MVQLDLLFIENNSRLLIGQELWMNRYIRSVVAQIYDIMTLFGRILKIIRHDVIWSYIENTYMTL